MTVMLKIPESMTIFFQEIDPAQLDLSRDADTIIERTLRFGNRAELRWLFACYGQPRIAAWVRDMGQYRLPERPLAFWRLLFDLDPAAYQPDRKALWPH